MTIGDDDEDEGASGSPPGIVGTWQTEALGGAAPEAGVTSDVTFSEDGRVSGHGGVNRFGGSYVVRGDELELGPVFSTRMAGPEPAMAHEAALLAVLQGTRRFALEADVLTIGVGPDELRLRRAPGGVVGDGAA
jgi:heat shock protein HslJ